MCRCPMGYECPECMFKEEQQAKPTPHKHAALIKAWADGAKIQTQRNYDDGWYDVPKPLWSFGRAYRIKPEPDKVKFCFVNSTSVYGLYDSPRSVSNIKLLFDGETDELKSVEIIK